MLFIYFKKCQYSVKTPIKTPNKTPSPALTINWLISLLCKTHRDHFSPHNGDGSSVVMLAAAAAITMFE